MYNYLRKTRTNIDKFFKKYIYSLIMKYCLKVYKVFFLKRLKVYIVGGTQQDFTIKQQTMQEKFNKFNCKMQENKITCVKILLQDKKM